MPAWSGCRRAGGKQHAAILHHGTGVNGVAIAFLLRHWFAGEHRFIKPGFALAYHAVDRDAVAGSQAQRHAGLNFRERQIFLASAATTRAEGGVRSSSFSSAFEER